MLQRIIFTPLQGKISDYRVYALLAPHLVNAGMENSGWVGEQQDIPLLYASGRSRYLALGQFTAVAQPDRPAMSGNRTAISSFPAMAAWSNTSAPMTAISR